MSAGVFAKLTERINTHSGIVYSQGKRQLVETRLRKRLRALKLDNFDAYLAYLASPDGVGEVDEMINVITTNLTSFFREKHHFDDLAQTLTPTFGTQDTSRRIRIWSAACSTGEEPYSIAMTMLQAGLAGGNADLRILATDLDTTALQKAESAAYPAKRLESCLPEYRSRYFDKLASGDVQVKDNVRNLIRFNRLNLHEQWPINGPFDVIFCRNVMIYFAEAAKQKLVSRFVDLLHPGGTLYLGHSESMLGAHPDLIKQGRTIFRKVA